MIDLRGAHLPVTTPFDPVSGDVDLVALRANLRHWCRSPIRGVLVSGTTGESVFLDEAERVAVLEAAREVVPEGVVLMAGTGTEATRHAVRNAVDAGARGADAVLVSPPAYFKGAMTPEALARHYRAVADASPVPVLVYQVPLRMSTLDLPTGLVAELSRHPNIVGIKDSRGRLDLVGELVTGCERGFHVLVGSGAHLYGGLEVGAVGGIVAVGLLAPEETAGICSAFVAGRAEEAGALQERIAPVHDKIIAGMGIGGVKAALDLLGLHGGAPRPPLTSLAAGRTDELRAVLEGAGLFVDTTPGAISFS